MHRSGMSNATPESTICGHVNQLHNQVKKRRQRMAVEHYLSPRNIQAVECIDNELWTALLSQ